MKNLWWLSLVAAVLLTAPAALFAQVVEENPTEQQDEPAPEQEAQKEQEEEEAQEDSYAWIGEYLERISERAELSEDEKEILQERITKLVKEMEEVRKKAQDELKGSLGEERFQELERFLRGFFRGPRNRGDRGRRGRRGGLRGIVDRAREELGLDDEQVQKFEELWQGARDRMREMFRRAREDGEGFEGMRERIEEEMESFREEMNEFLSEEQQEKLEKMMEDMRNRGGRRRGRGRRGGDRENPGEPEKEDREDY